MLLALDIGNTNMTLGLVAARPSWPAGGRQRAPSATPDELEVLIDGLLRLDGASLADVTGISLASVCRPLDRRRRGDRRATRPAAALCDCRDHAYPRPNRAAGRVGLTACVNGLAVGRLYGTPAIVVDFGTATTLDCVARDGAYVGGAIAPGLEIGSRRWRRGRLASPHRAGRANEGDRHGHDFGHAVGIVIGYRALTLGLLERIRPSWLTPRRSRSRPSRSF